MRGTPSNFINHSINQSNFYFLHTMHRFVGTFVCKYLPFPIVVEYLVEIIYNTSYKKHKEVLKILNNVYCNSNADIILIDNKDYGDLSTFIKICFNILFLKIFFLKKKYILKKKIKTHKNFQKNRFLKKNV